MTTKEYLLSTTAACAPAGEAGAAEAETPEPTTRSVTYSPETGLPPTSARRGRPQAPRAPPTPPQRRAYSVSAFCEAHGFSVPMLYKMWAKGEGPAIMKVGVRTLISVEAADRWRRDRERATQQLKTG